MGCRLDGAKIEHVKGGDIVSDGVPLGAVQVPSHGMPIVMLADRQTTGGYTKIGVLTPLSIEALVQKMPGSAVRFRKASIDDGTAEQMKIAETVRRVGRTAQYLRLASARGEDKRRVCVCAPPPDGQRQTVRSNLRRDKIGRGS